MHKKNRFLEVPIRHYKIWKFSSGLKCLHLVRMRENAIQKNSEYGHFSRNEY